MGKNKDKEMYARQIIEMSEQSKETLIIRKEIIIDNMSDEELGKWIRTMYKAKCESADNHIEHIKRTNEN
jgi:hypothetical protein